MQKNYLLTTNFQWQIIGKFFIGKRKPKWDYRIIWERLCYVTKTGCQWRMLHCIVPWQTVYWYYDKWKWDGTIEAAHDALRKKVRQLKRRKEDESVGIIDSASVRMSSVGGNARKGIDGNKKIKGSKRHIIVDTLGLIICLSVHAAHIHDSKGAKEVLNKLYAIRHDHPKLIKIFADGGYEGDLGKRLKKQLNIDMEIVKRNETDKWEVLPKRWIVERTFAWLMNFRRLVMDYERHAESVEAHIYIAMIILMGKKFN